MVDVCGVRVQLRIGTLSLVRHCGQAYVPHLPRNPILRIGPWENTAQTWPNPSGYGMDGMVEVLKVTISVNDILGGTCMGG